VEYCKNKVSNRANDLLPGIQAVGKDIHLAWEAGDNQSPAHVTIEDQIFVWSKPMAPGGGSVFSQTKDSP
jgi:hypothetical protein